MGFRPAIQSSSKSAAKAMPIGGDGAGFSWIAFCWPFAVLTQIREFSYFGVASIVFIISAWLHVITGVDLSSFVGVVLGICYGYWFPYLRYLAIQEGRQEFSVLASFILGIALWLAALIPSIVIEKLLF